MFERGVEKVPLAKLEHLSCPVHMRAQYALAPVVQEPEERVRFAGAKPGGNTKKKTTFMSSTLINATLR